jgi:hypothetical protein
LWQIFHDPEGLKGFVIGRNLTWYGVFPAGRVRLATVVVDIDRDAGIGGL